MIIEGENIVINTGGRPVIPNIKGIENNKNVFLSEDIMNLEKLPKTLTIIGGGYIGLEFASIYAGFGSDVTIIQNEEEFLPREDEDIVNAIRKTLEEKGIKISGIVISRYYEDILIDNYINKLKILGYNVYKHYNIEGYPLDIENVVNENGLRKK